MKQDYSLSCNRDSADPSNRCNNCIYDALDLSCNDREMLDIYDSDDDELEDID